MNTFDDLKQPFPLFKAPIAHAAVDEAGRCAICDGHAVIRFGGACYDCFRSGKVDSAMDTELGLVTRYDAEKGRTHGIPLSDPSELADYDLTPHPVDPRFPNSKWYHVHVDREEVIELLRTPKYRTWQGETWLFCCKRPMVFRGSLPSDLFGDEFDNHPTAIAEFLNAPDWKRTVDDAHGSHTYYTFTCGLCGHLRFHADCD